MNLQRRFMSLGIVLLFSTAAALPQPAHTGASAGMGVTYSSSRELVDLVNGTTGAQEKLAEFHAGAEFFVSVSIPLSEEWVLKLDYGYQVASYNIATLYETAQFTLTQHCPTIIIQHVLAEQGIFNLKAGAGIGYHFGNLAERFLYIDNSFGGKGPGVIAELEGNTALGEHLFIHLGVNARWELIGELTDSSGKFPGTTSSGGHPTLNSFGVGARMGVTYYFF